MLLLSNILLLTTTSLSFITALWAPSFGKSQKQRILSHTRPLYIVDGRQQDSVIARVANVLLRPLRLASPHCDLNDEFLRPSTARYGDDVVLRFEVRTTAEANALMQAIDTLYIDMWEHSQNWIDVRISRSTIEPFLSFLPESLHRGYKPIVHDLSSAVKESFSHPHGTFDARKTSVHVPHDLFFQDYQRLSVIYPWLRQLAEIFPEKAELFSIGKSYQGRDIPALRVGISVLQEDNGPRPTIIIVAGSHAREWVSVSTAAYALRSLLHNYNRENKKTVDSLLRAYDIVFVPVLNPDGYDYTWTTDRLWRKNRQNTKLPFCPGIDIDQSFSVNRSGDIQYDDPCSETYPGEHALQAVESQRLAYWTQNETLEGRRTIEAFLDLHSYSQQILYPYSRTCKVSPPNLEDLEEIAYGISKSLRLSGGHQYTVESACEGSNDESASTGSSPLREAQSLGGSALDYFYEELHVKYAFQIKLRDTGTYGFLLPKQHIVPTGEEVLSAILSLGRWLLSKQEIEGFDGLCEAEIWGEESTIMLPASSAGPEQDQNDEAGFWWRRRK